MIDAAVVRDVVMRSAAMSLPIMAISVGNDCVGLFEDMLCWMLDCSTSEVSWADAMLMSDVQMDNAASEATAGVACAA